MGSEAINEISAISDTKNDDKKVILMEDEKATEEIKETRSELIDAAAVLIVSRTEGQENVGEQVKKESDVKKDSNKQEKGDEQVKNGSSIKKEPTKDPIERVENESSIKKEPKKEDPIEQVKIESRIKEEDPIETFKSKDSEPVMNEVLTTNNDVVDTLVVEQDEAYEQTDEQKYIFQLIVVLLKEGILRYELLELNIID